MSRPLVVTISHSLGQEEATRRLKDGFGTAQTKFANVLTFHEQTWTGNTLNVHVSALGQHARGTIEVRQADVRLELQLPWLLAKVAEQVIPTIQREGRLMLDKT